MDPYNSGNPLGLGPRHRKPKRKYFAKLFILMALILLPLGGYIVYQYLTSTQQQADVKSVQSLQKVPTPNLDKARVEKWNGITKKVAYLTFEDGPTALTPDILKSLKEQNVKATFFLIGSNIAEQPDVVR